MPMDRPNNPSARRMSPATEAELEQLYVDCLDIYDRARAEVTFINEAGRQQHYVASYFIRDIERARSDGSNVTTAVSRIVLKDTKGFGRLEDARRPDLTLEVLVLDPKRPYHGLFRSAVKNKARERLVAYEARTGDRSWRALVACEQGDSAEPSADERAERAKTVADRIIRSTQVTAAVKRIYGHRCQVCGLVLVTRDGPYAEGAHIRPLGEPHNGPDVIGNVLCLCPNDHVRLDRGSIWIDQAGHVVDGKSGAILRPLDVHADHVLRDDCLRYHRELWLRRPAD